VNACGTGTRIVLTLLAGYFFGDVVGTGLTDRKRWLVLFEIWTC
jgi:hypothetical protein